MSREAAASLDRLLRQVTAGSCPTPVLLQGEEDYRVEEARRRLLAALFPDEDERKAAVETVSAREMPLTSILERAAEAPLFASCRALVVRDAEHLGRAAGAGASPRSHSGGPPRAGARGSPWDTAPPGAVIILVARPGLDRRTRAYREIEERGVVLTFPRIKNEREVAQWAARYLRYWKKSISPEASSLLTEYTISHDGVSLRQLAQELDKLTLYVGERKRIERGDVEALVGRSREELIFALTNALGERSVPRALARLTEFLERGEQPLALLALLARELRVLLQARFLLEAHPRAREASRLETGEFQRRILPGLKERVRESGPAGAVEILGWKPYGVHKKLQLAERFTVPELLRGTRLAAEADRELKSSGRPPRLVLESLVIKLAGGEGQRPRVVPDG